MQKRFSCRSLPRTLLFVLRIVSALHKWNGCPLYKECKRCIIHYKSTAVVYFFFPFQFQFRAADLYFTKARGHHMLFIGTWASLLFAQYQIVGLGLMEATGKEINLSSGGHLLPSIHFVLNLKKQPWELSLVFTVSCVVKKRSLLKVRGFTFLKSLIQAT